MIDLRYSDAMNSFHGVICRVPVAACPQLRMISAASSRNQMAARRAEALLRVVVPLKCKLPRRVGPGLSVRSVELTLQVRKFRMHRTDCVLDLGVETTGLLASALCTIANPFEIVDTLPHPILIVG